DRALNGVRMQGLGPLIAGSPTTHDSMPLGQAIDVQHYQQNAALWGGAMSMDGCMDSQPPPFQQLVSTYNSILQRRPAASRRQMRLGRTPPAWMP
uniref:Uncharacterized protein n=1 Tax=Plectus sambesii TaxID=2011161 RepID=A0A914VM26_9BILA